VDNIKAIQEIKDLIKHGYISHSDLMKLAAMAYEEEAKLDHRSDHE
jgi:6-phosphogluconate dehydrogenase (decarboxylating)